MTRIYRPAENSTWRNKLSKMIASSMPFYFIKIETTGLDASKDDIIAIRCIKCIWNDGILASNEEFKRIILSDKLTPEISKINGITNDFMEEHGIDLIKAFADFSDFIGDGANLISFNIQNFVGPFLTAAMRKTGIKLNILNTLDLYHMSRSLVVVSKYSKSYGHKKLAEALNINDSDVLKSFISMFNIMYQRIPMGTKNEFLNFVKGVKLWNNNKNVSYLYITTIYGQIRFNNITMFFEDTDDGLFDIINIDEFEKYLLRKQKVETMKDFVKIYTKEK